MILPRSPDLVEDATYEQKRRAARCAMRHVLDGPDRKRVMAALFQPVTRTVPLDAFEPGTPEEADAVRAWAAEHDIYVSKNGRPPARVVALYRAAAAEQAEQAADGIGGPR